MLIASSLVVIHDLHIPRRRLAPFKAYTPLIVDADAVLPAPVADRHPEVRAIAPLERYGEPRRMRGPDAAIPGPLSFEALAALGHLRMTEQRTPARLKPAVT